MDMTIPKVDDKRQMRILWEDVLDQIYDSSLDTADLGRAIRYGHSLQLGLMILKISDKVSK